MNDVFTMLTRYGSSLVFFKKNNNKLCSKTCGVDQMVTKFGTKKILF